MSYTSAKLEFDNNNYSIFICVVADRPINGFVERGFAYSTISSSYSKHTFCLYMQFNTNSIEMET